MGIFFILCKGLQCFLVTTKRIPHKNNIVFLCTTLNPCKTFTVHCVLLHSTTITKPQREQKRQRIRMGFVAACDIWVAAMYMYILPLKNTGKKDGESLMRIQYICQNSCSFRTQCSPKPNEISYVAPLWTMGQIVTLTICIRTINWNVV